MKTLSILMLGFALIAAVAGCAPGPNRLADTADEDGVVAGFWRGLWNGIISPVTFVISLFNQKIRMYNVHNNGGWYDLGFLLGVVAISGGGASSRKSKRQVNLQ